MAHTGGLVCAAPACSVQHHEARSSVACFSTDAAPRQVSTQEFSYSRASPAVRWPHLKLSPQSQPPVVSPPLDSEGNGSPRAVDCAEKDEAGKGAPNRPSWSKKARKLSKLELLRDKNWRDRVQFLTDKILGLGPQEFVADVLDNRLVQMTPTDFCFVVKWVGQSSWRRALEVYEWLNVRHWFSPNPRMLATILSVLGKANQEALAIEIFTRAEDAIGNTVQVYNAMMGVYARNGRFGKVQELLDLMHTRGCVPDLVSFNTLINARTRSGFRSPDMAVELLNEVRRSGLKPDIITYNTLISACSRESYLEEAEKVYNDMVIQKCLPDLWTYNAMISVYGRCGLPAKAEQLFEELDLRGFVADAVTYNSLLHAFAKEGNVDKVKEIHKEMLIMGFGKDEVTYNTIIHMYGKLGHQEMALELHNEMKLSGRKPDAITYAILIDILGKANKIMEAAHLMSEMLDVGVKPTLQAFSALISGYAKAGKILEAEEMFDCMLRSGIKPDHMAYSIMLDALLRFNEVKKVMSLYSDMVRNGFIPDLGLYEILLQVLSREKNEEGIMKVVEDMKRLSDLRLPMISSILVKHNCYDHASKILISAITQGLELDHENLLFILNSFNSSGRHFEALDVINYLREHEHAAGYHTLIIEAHVFMLCKTHQLDAALKEYQTSMFSGLIKGSLTMYETLIQCCEENKLFTEASQLFCDMNFYGIGPSQEIYHRMVCIYSKMAFPETAHHVLNQAQERGILLENSSVYVGLIEGYGRLKLWEKAEKLVESVRQRYMSVDLMVWNTLLEAYATCGYYERARAVFNVMMRDGPSPSINSMNSLLRALIVDGRLDELYVVIQEFQDMGFRINKSSIILMLDAFVLAGNIFEVKKIYRGMRAAGFRPTMHHYRVMIELFCRGKRAQDVEGMVAEIEDWGFKPDLSIWNALIKLYTNIGNFKKAMAVHLRIRADGLEPNEDTYNSLILMYCSDVRPEEGLVLIHEMNKLGLHPKLDTYKSLISVCGKRQLWEQAEALFNELLSKQCELDRSFFHIMMKIYRSSGDHFKAERLLDLMKEKGVEPTISTMHLLMSSYSKSGLPQEAEMVLENLKRGPNISTLPYSTVIDAYLKNKDYEIGIEKLTEMQEDGILPDHRIWTCFIRAASLSESTSEALALLGALKIAGFDLPIRFLTEKSDSLINEVDNYLEKLEPVEDDAALNFVNSMEDLLWAFELRSKASWLFQLAIKRSIFHHDVFRVADKDWGADFRKLSAGSALAGLTLWLDYMQDASLQGSPESSKSVVLITGTSEYNMVSLNNTLKVTLWEMGSPFFPCKTRSGVLVAKGHSLRMWLKESPFCLDLELKDAPALPELNSMRIIDGCFMRRGLVSAFKDIEERLGPVRPKKFSRLALLTDSQRDHAIHADVEGAKEKLEKMKRRGDLTWKVRKAKLRRIKLLHKGRSKVKLAE